MTGRRRSYTKQEELRLMDAKFLLEEARLEASQSFYDKAMELCSQAQGIFHRLEYRAGLVDTLVEIASLQRSKSLFRDAISSGEAALAIAKDGGLLPSRAKVLSGLGVAYLRLGDLEQALEHYQQALLE